MASQHLLAVDVGNTRAKFGVFETDAASSPQVVAISAVRIVDAASVAEELQGWLSDYESLHISRTVVAGSNPPVRDQLLSDWPVAGSVPRLVHHHTEVPIAVDVDEPDRVGIDRLLTAFAAQRLFAPTQAVIVVDSGTATTINLTTSDGIFRGGSILPGLRLSAHALHDYTARLPFVDTDEVGESVAASDAPVPGRNTTEAIRSGLFWGQLGAIKELKNRMAEAAKEEFHDQSEPICFLTGGGGRQLSPHLTPAIYVDSLALHGLALLATH